MEVYCTQRNCLCHEMGLCFLLCCSSQRGYVEILSSHSHPCSICVWQEAMKYYCTLAAQLKAVYSSMCINLAGVSTGSFLWLGQSRKDLFCIWDQDLQMRPLTIQFPPDVEMVQLSACRDALWGLDHYGRVHIRTLSASCSTGIHWTLLDLSQLGERIFFP